MALLVKKVVVTEVEVTTVKMDLDRIQVKVLDGTGEGVQCANTAWLPAHLDIDIETGQIRNWVAPTIEQLQTSQNTDDLLIDALDPSIAVQAAYEQLMDQEAQEVAEPNPPAVDFAERFAATVGAQDPNSPEIKPVENHQIDTPAPVEEQPKLWGVFIDNGCGTCQAAPSFELATAYSEVLQKVRPDYIGIISVKEWPTGEIHNPRWFDESYQSCLQTIAKMDAEAAAALNDDLSDDYATTAPDNQIDIEEQIARSIEIPETDLPTVSVVNINGKWTAQYGDQFASSSKSVFAAIDGALRKSGATGAFEINRHYSDGNKEIFTVNGSRTQGRQTIFVSHSAAKNEWVARTSDNKRAASVVGVDGALIALLDTIYKTDPSEASPIETTDDEMRAEGKRRYSIIVPSVRKNPPAPPLYLNPDDHTKTWTGRGNPPAWLQEKLNAGAALENFLIDGNSTHKPEKMPSYGELVQAISIAPNVAVLMKLQTNYVSKWPVFDQVSGLHRKINERSSELSNANPTA